jgi:hypothetical protein
MRAVIRLVAALCGLVAGLVIGFQTIPKSQRYIHERGVADISGRPFDSAVPMYDMSESGVHRHLMWDAFVGTSAGLFVGWLVTATKKGTVIGE